MNYFEIWIGDYLKKTLSLSTAEHGAYMMLLLFYYAEEQALPNDPEILYALCKARSKSEKKAVDKIVEKFFFLHSDGFVHHARCDAEIEKYNSKILTNKENGKKGGRPRKSLEKPEEKTEGLSLGYGLGYENGNPNDNPNETEQVTQSESEIKAPQSPYPILLSLSEFGYENFTKQVAFVMETKAYTGKEQNVEKLSAKLWNTAKTEPKVKEEWIRYIHKLAIMEK